ncbi:hypothetical protein [Subtercola vilae]|uniref:hypothetical protein n=1 Tax=Subtercola vilae TaxID=2056433 RepID=UPI00191E3016|nr:hypothetical protein [Subtercola vilae]
MARVTLTPTALTGVTSAGANATADPSGTASVAGAGNGFTISYTGSKVVLLRVSNASGGTGTVSVLGGSQPLAVSGGQGAATASIATAGTSWIGPFESARFAQPDGSYTIETSVIMTVTAFTIDGRQSA